MAKQEKVLVAEDDAISREVLASQLKKLGYDVICAGNGNEAWARYTEEEIRLVVTDWKMPGMDGPELCRRIRSEKRERYTYIILLTAVDRKEGYVTGIAAGADDFIAKPMTLEELRVRLRVADRVLSLQAEARQLSHLLPICPRCKRIRTGEGEWQQVEAYIMGRTDAQFSHGICPACVETILKPQLERYQAQRRQQRQA
jgi:DNA-binding response OmpR family regulator